MSQLKTSLLIMTICFAKSMFANTLCGDWETYKDEKCIKLIDSLQNYYNAENICGEYNSSLITIKAPEEQQFIENYLFISMSVVEDVWIGMRYIDSKYKWINDLEVNYTNWAKGSPKSKSDYCVQINSNDETTGNWSDISCMKRNLVLCQKLQPLTAQRVMEMFLDTRKQFENTVQLLSDKLVNTSKELENTKLQQSITRQLLENTVKLLNSTIMELKQTNTKLESTKDLAEKTNIKLNKTNKHIDYFFNNKWVSFKTFSDENNTRKALIYPFKNQYNMLRSVAIDICGENNGTLVNIESIEKQKLVESFLYQINPKSEYHYYWIGGYSDSMGKYKWLNSGNDFKFTNWAQNPDSNSSQYTLIVFDFERSDNGKWYTTVLNALANVICELTIFK